MSTDRVPAKPRPRRSRSRAAAEPAAPVASSDLALRPPTSVAAPSHQPATGDAATSAEPVLEGEVVDADDPLLADVLLGDIETGDDAEAALPAASADVVEAGAEVTPSGAALIPLAAGSGVLVRDALTRYLADVNRFPRLTPEEEHDLAVRYRDAGDREALARLVTSNLRLVVAVAMSFRRAIANVLDLIQEGNLGLLEAIDRFDPYKGTRLSTYATWWIRSRIVKYMLDNWRLVRVGTTNARRKLLYNLRQEKARLVALGVEPTPKLLAERLGTTQEDVVAVDQAIGASDVSLDAPVGEDNSARRGDFIPSPAASPEGLAADEEVRARLRELIAEFSRSLSARERALLTERLLADEPITLQDIADREGVTREAVRQSEQRLTDRLRRFLMDRFPEAAEMRFGEGV